MRESLLAVPAVRKRPFFYGWVIVATLAVTETVSYGILYYAFAIFIDPMRAEFGWSSSAVTGAFSLALLISGFSAPLVGMWLDRRGPRLLMTAGSVVGTMMVLAWSRVDSLLPYYAIWLGMGFAMATTFYEPAFATLTRWFERDRRRAIVYVTLVAGFASTIFLPVASWLEERYGWREALVALAVVLGVMTILPHALVLRRRPEDLGLHPDGAAAASISVSASSTAFSTAPPPTVPRQTPSEVRRSFCPGDPGADPCRSMTVAIAARTPRPVAAAAAANTPAA